jgi:hypothetical protein
LRNKQAVMFKNLAIAFGILAVIMIAGFTNALGYWRFPNQGQSMTTTTQFSTQTSYQYGQPVYTQTQIVTTSSSLGAAGASCQIALTRTTINAGENVAGQLTSNRAGVEVQIFHRLVGEAIDPNVITGLTDNQGSWLAFSGQILIPGIYQIGAALNFPAQSTSVPCTPIITVTVHGFLVQLDRTSVSMGSPFNINVYSDMPSQAFEVQYRLTSDPARIFVRRVKQRKITRNWKE